MNVLFKQRMDTLFAPHLLVLSEQQFQACLQLDAKVKAYHSSPLHNQKTIFDLIFNNTPNTRPYALTSNAQVQEQFPGF